MEASKMWLSIIKQKPIRIAWSLNHVVCNLRMNMKMKKKKKEEKTVTNNSSK